MKRILIADDHAIHRKGLVETLEEELGRTTFGHAENNQQLLEMVWKEKWDLVLLDINMDKRSGLEILAGIHKARPKLPVFDSQACIRSRNSACAPLNWRGGIR